MKKQTIYVTSFLVVLVIIHLLLNKRFIGEYWGLTIFIWLIISGFIFTLVYFKTKVKKIEQEYNEINKLSEENLEKAKELNIQITELEKEINYLLSNEAETYYFDIDCSRNFEELVAQGNYDWQNNDVKSFRSNKPDDSKKILKVAAKVFEFNGSVDEVEANMISKGFHPATAFELLVFGTTFAEIQKDFPIMAMGTVVKELYSNSICLCLYNCSSKRKPGQRGLGVHYYVYGKREPNCHLLGIKVL